MDEDDHNQKCSACGGACCRSFCIDIDPPQDLDGFQDIKWYLFHRGVTVCLNKDGSWEVDTAIPCMHLDENNGCRIYPDRPPVCRDYTLEDCEGDDYAEVFRTPEDIDAYVEKLRKEGKLKPGRIFK
ncbi:YkgJ family cysteine cluster protein [Candidatus Woesearchaeota archaeon]|nr:YkgJ family cysteine cluster protein [Candidatus Woesearchaeota archaeon]